MVLLPIPPLRVLAGQGVKCSYEMERQVFDWKVHKEASIHMNECVLKVK